MPIPDNIVNIIEKLDPKRTSINLSDRGLDSDDIQNLVVLLNKNKFITKLDLYRNNLDNDAAIHLEKLQHVKEINLAYNHFDDAAVLFLARSKFIKINLKDNDDLTEAGIEIFIKKSPEKHIEFNCFIKEETLKQMKYNFEQQKENQSSNNYIYSLGPH